jgi:4-hydroxymandelate oxidase
VFTAGPPARPPPGADLHLIRAERQTFSGPAEYLRDPVSRGDVGTYMADLTRPYAIQVTPGLFGESLSPALGHSYGEMGQALIRALVPADEPVDLLVLAFSVHDLWPSRATAAHLSHLCPGTPMSFAICDQGSAAAFSALRIAREYATSAGCRRVLLIVAEQAALPYPTAAPLPSRHRGVAMLYGDAPPPLARVVGLRQHPAVAVGSVPVLAAADLAELSAGRGDARLVLSDTLAAAWPAPAAGRVRVAGPGQPSTGVWWELVDELADDADRPGLVVAADYDPGLRYLCLAAIEPG